MEITYLYRGIVLRLQSTEMIGMFHKWKSLHKRKPCLIRLTINANLFISKNHYLTLFSRIKLFFSLLQTTTLNLKWLTTLQQPWTNWLAPTMWTLVKAKTDLENFLVRKFFRPLGRETQSVQEGRKQTISTGTKLDNGRGRFYSTYSTEKSASVAVRDFSKEESLPPVQVKLLAKDMEEQLKLTHKFVEVVDRPRRKICMTMLRYIMEKLKTSYVQLRLFGRRKDEQKFNQIDYVNNKLDEFIYLLDVMNSVYEKVIANEPLCNVL